MKLSSLLRSAVAFGLLASLPACQTVQRQFPTPNASWRTSIGQLQYVTRQRSVIGETVVSRHGAQEFQLDFTAGAGLPLMKLRETGASARADGVFAHGAWQGDPARALGSLTTWMKLRDAFAAIDAARPPAGARPVTVSGGTGHRAWTARISGSQPERVQIVFPATHERFVFVFSK